MEIHETPLTPEQAWKDFWENVKPSIWASLTDKEKNRLIHANRDTEGKRIDSRTKKLVRLGAARIERLLIQYGSGRYRVEKTLVFYLNE